MIIKVNKDNFKEVVQDPEKLVIVDLWAEWCAPCRAMEPVIEEVASANREKVRVAKINVDENPDLATELQVMSIPALLFFKNGKEVYRATGYNTSGYIQKKIEEFETS